MKQGQSTLHTLNTSATHGRRTDRLPLRVKPVSASSGRVQGLDAGRETRLQVAHAQGFNEVVLRPQRQPDFLRHRRDTRPAQLVQYFTDAQSKVRACVVRALQVDAARSAEQDSKSRDAL